MKKKYTKTSMILTSLIVLLLGNIAAVCGQALEAPDEIRSPSPAIDNVIIFSISSSEDIDKETTTLHNYPEADDAYSLGVEEEDKKEEEIILVATQYSRTGKKESDGLAINQTSEGGEVSGFLGSKTTRIKVTAEELDKGSDLSFSIIPYPNPATMEEVLKVKTSSSEKLTLQLLDFNGQPIQVRLGDSGDQLYEFNIATLPTGTYLVRAISEQGIIIKQVRIIN